MLRRVDGISEAPDRFPHEMCGRTPRIPHHAVRAASRLCRGVWTGLEKGCFGFVDARQTDRTALQRKAVWSQGKHNQRLYLSCLLVTWTASVCAITRALLVCFFPVPPTLLHVQPRVRVSVGVLLSLFVIGSPSFLLLFPTTAVLRAALLSSLTFFCVFMVFTWAFPLLPPRSAFWSTGALAAARALRLFTLFTFGFLLFLLLLLSTGFLWSFWRACLRLGLLRFVASSFCGGTFLTGEIKTI